MSKGKKKKRLTEEEFALVCAIVKVWCEREKERKFPDQPVATGPISGQRAAPHALCLVRRSEEGRYGRRNKADALSEEEVA